MRVLSAVSLAGTITAPYQTFVTRPDLTPPILSSSNIGSLTPGLILFDSRGPEVHNTALVIADHKGEIVYVRHAGKNAIDFKVQHLDNFGGEKEPYITFWNGDTISASGSADGNYFMLDESLSLAANISLASTSTGDQDGDEERGGGDCHEFNIDRHDHTAVTPFYYLKSMNLSQWGGPGEGWVRGSGIRMVDLSISSKSSPETSKEGAISKAPKVLFEWKCTDHISPDESWSRPGGEEGDGRKIPDRGKMSGAWDYVNSVDKHPTDGFYLISSRHTSSLYKISKTGEIDWVLRGLPPSSPNSKLIDSFHHGPGTLFSRQHHARWRSPTEISLFDNGPPTPGAYSRGLRLRLDMKNSKNYSVELIQELYHPEKLQTRSQGSLQYLPNGNFWLSMGEIPQFLEFAPNGTLHSTFHTISPGFNSQTYRSFKQNFTINPHTIVDVALVNQTVYMSWNGATRVKYWNVYSAPSEGHDELQLVRIVKKSGFETNFTFSSPYDVTKNWTKVEALDENGVSLKLSKAIKGELVDVQPISFALDGTLASQIVFTT